MSKHRKDDEIKHIEQELHRDERKIKHLEHEVRELEHDHNKPTAGDFTFQRSR